MGLRVRVSIENVLANDEKVFKIYSRTLSVLQQGHIIVLVLVEGSYDNHVISEPDLWTMHEEVK